MSEDVKPKQSKSGGDSVIHPQVFICAGKKKYTEGIIAWINGLKAKGCEVLALHQKDIPKLLRSVEEVKVMVNQKSDLVPPEDIVGKLDYAMVTEKATVVASMSTFKETDMWLKWNIKEQTGQFQLRGGVIDIREEKERQANGAVVRICNYTLKGEMTLVLKYRDRLIEQKLCDPKSVTYSFG